MSAPKKTPSADKIPASSRRDFMKQAGAFSLTAVALGLMPARPGWALPRSAGGKEENDLKILESALAHEQEAIAAYQVGAESGLLQKSVLTVAVKFQSQHKTHADLLASTIHQMGGKAMEARPISAYHFPVNKLKSQNDVLQFAAGLEKAAASAYLGAVPRLHDRALAKVAASILGDESMHWAVLRNALGEDPVPVAFIS